MFVCKKHLNVNLQKIELFNQSRELLIYIYFNSQKNSALLHFSYI